MLRLLLALLLVAAPARADDLPPDLRPCLPRPELDEMHCTKLTYDLLVRSAVTAQADRDRAELARQQAVTERDAATQRADLAAALPCPEPASLVIPVALAALGGVVAGLLLAAAVQ